MASDADPVVGTWYRQLDKGQRFKVVAVDEDHGLVELQHYDGDLEEIDIDAWYQMDLEPVEAPEEWSGPVDDFEADDLDYSETNMDEDDWESGTDDFERGGGARKRRRSPLDEDEDEDEDFDEDYSDRWEE